MRYIVQVPAAICQAGERRRTWADIAPIDGFVRMSDALDYAYGIDGHWRIVEVEIDRTFHVYSVILDNREHAT